MEEKIEEFKRFHKIETDIDLPFKIENDRLFTFYNDRWVQLSREKNPQKFYSPATLQTYYNTGLLKKLGLSSTKEKYSKEMYAKYSESYRKASKKYYAKIYQDEKNKEKYRESARKYYAEKKQKNLRN